MTMTTSADPKKLAGAVRAAMTTDVIQAARLLRDIQDNIPHLLHDVRRAAKIGRRKAYAPIQVDRCFRGLKVSVATLRRIGWTKLVVLAPHVTEQNIQQLLAMAEENTVYGLKVLLGGGEVSEDFRVVLMYFTPLQYEVFEKALIKHGATKEGRGIAGKEDALAEILTVVAQGGVTCPTAIQRSF